MKKGSGVNLFWGLVLSSCGHRKNQVIIRPLSPVKLVRAGQIILASDWLRIGRKGPRNTPRHKTGVCHSLLICCQVETSRSKALDLKLLAKKDCLIFLLRAFQWIAYFNVVTCEEGVAICFVGFPGDRVYIVDFSLEEGAYFVEGSSVDEFCNVVNQQKIINSLWRFGSGLEGSDSN